MGLACSSYVGPYSEPKVEGQLGLAKGAEVTTRPTNARLIVCRIPGMEKAYDSVSP